MSPVLEITEVQTQLLAGAGPHSQARVDDPRSLASRALIYRYD